MENASKALLIAASVLIALLIIGALTLMFNNLTRYQNVGTDNEKEAQVVEFNNQFETYNRKNVRGSDIYSIFNRVIDYNKRKSTQGTGEKNEGQYIAYQPMEVTIDFDGKMREFASDGQTNLLIKRSSYTQNSTNNQFEKDMKEGIKDVENKLRW